MSIEAELLILPDIKDSDLTRAINKIDREFKKSAQRMKVEYRKAIMAGMLEGVTASNKKMGALNVSGVTSSASTGNSDSTTTTTNIYNQGGGVNPLLLGAGYFALRPKKEMGDTLENSIVRATKKIRNEEKKQDRVSLLSVGEATALAYPGLHELATTPERVLKRATKSLRGDIDEEFITNFVSQHVAGAKMAFEMEGRVGPMPSDSELELEALRDFYGTKEGKRFARGNFRASLFKGIPSAVSLGAGALIAGFELNDMANQYIQQQSGQRLATWMPTVGALGARQEPEIIAEAKRIGIPLADVYTMAAAWGMNPRQALELANNIKQQQALDRHTGNKNGVFGKNLKEDLSVSGIVNRFTKATPEEQRVMADKNPFLQPFVGMKTFTKEGMKEMAAEGEKQAKEALEVEKDVLEVRKMQAKLDKMRLDAMKEIDTPQLEAYFQLEAEKIKDASKNAAQAKEDAEKFITASNRLADSGAIYEKAAIIFSNAVAMFTGKASDSENMTVTVNLGLNDSSSQSLAVGQLPTHIPGAGKGTGMNNVWNVQTRTSYTPND